MKKLWILSLLALSSFSAQAQLPDFQDPMGWNTRSSLIQSLGFQNYEFEIHQNQVSVVIFRIQSFADDSNRRLMWNVSEVAQFYRYDPRIQFYTVDVFAESFLTAQMKIQKFPTTLVYRWGELVNTVEGYQNIEDIFEMIDQPLNQ